MTIAFNSIPANIRTPGVYTEFDNSRAVQGSPALPNVSLIIGQRLAAGTVAEAVPTSVSSSAKGEAFFGHGSILAGMIEAYKAANPHTELWAIALDDAGGAAAAAGTYTWTGTSTEAASIFVYIAGHRIEVAIPTGTAAAAVDPLVVTAVTAYALKTNIPVVASGAVAVTTITALNAGTLGNGVKLEVSRNDGETLPAGITVAIVQSTGGATDPDVADAIAVLSDTWYTKIISAYADDTNHDKLEAQALTQWGPMDQRDVHTYIGAIGNQSALTALGNARNSQFTTLQGGGLSPTPAWIWASGTGAIDAAEPDPARPRQTLLLPGCIAPLPADRFTRAERDILLNDGVATFTVAQDGRCYIERLITTYQTNAISVVDVSYLDVMTMHSLAYLRYTWNVRVQLRYGRHKLADDGASFGPGQPVVTPSMLRAEAIALYLDTWVPDGVVEPAAIEQFKAEVRFERNGSDANRVDMVMPPDLMNQFMVMAGQIQFLL